MRISHYRKNNTPFIIHILTSNPYTKSTPAIYTDILLFERAQQQFA